MRASTADRTRSGSAAVRVRCEPGRPSLLRLSALVVRPSVGRPTAVTRALPMPGQPLVRVAWRTIAFTGRLSGPERYSAELDADLSPSVAVRLGPSAFHVERRSSGSEGVRQLRCTRKVATHSPARAGICAMHAIWRPLADRASEVELFAARGVGLLWSIWVTLSVGTSFGPDHGTSPRSTDAIRCNLRHLDPGGGHDTGDDRPAAAPAVRTEPCHSSSVPRGTAVATVPRGTARVSPMSITTDQQRRLERFADAVRASPHNLISPSAHEVLWERHVLEAVGLSQLLPASDAVTRLLDVGSGGGFPGMVIAIMRPDLDVSLLDSRQKKVDFLRETGELLGLSVRVLHGRAEELARQPDHHARYELVTARAVAPMERLLPWTMPFLAHGGLLYAVKGERWREELDAAAVALRRHHGRVVFTPDDPVPSVPQAPRTVIVTRDVADTS